MQDQSEFGSDIVDMRDVLERRDQIPPNKDAYLRDADDSEYLELVTELEGQLWTDLETVAHQYDPILILDSYFETYAQDFAEDIGAINREADWPANHIDWEAAADSLKMDFTEYTIGRYTYYGRQS